MSYVVTLENFRPSPRVDGVPWAEVRIEEAAELLGPYVALETQPLNPIDADPANPAVRDVTTTLATLATGWYRLVFIDAFGGVEESEPVGRSSAGVILPPQPDDVRQRSELLKQRYPSDPVDADVERRLREDVADAVAIIEAMTGRKLDGTLPAGLVRVAARAVTMKVEAISLTSGAKARRGAVAQLSLRSFTAGPYGESYFGPGEAAQAKSLDPDPALHALLWLLCTEEMQDYWLELWGLRKPRPGFAVQSFNYRRRRGGY